MVIFNRSHYEDVLVARVHKMVPKSAWSKRYELINTRRHHGGYGPEPAAGGGGQRGNSSQVSHCGGAAVTARTQAAKGVAQEVTTLKLGELVDVTREIPRDSDH